MGHSWRVDAVRKRRILFSFLGLMVTPSHFQSSLLPPFVWKGWTDGLKGIQGSKLEEATVVSKGKSKAIVSVVSVDCVWNVMEHAQKPDFVFRRNGRVHLNWRGRQFSQLLAAEVCASAVVMLDTPCSEVVWRVLATHSVRQFPLHFPSHALPCAITFQLESTAVVALLCLRQHWPSETLVMIPLITISYYSCSSARYVQWLWAVNCVCKQRERLWKRQVFLPTIQSVKVAMWRSGFGWKLQLTEKRKGQQFHDTTN
jgi:hypothetical protein